MAFATINGHRLRYRVEGDGPLVVFGHGLLGSIEQIEEQGGLVLRGLSSRLRFLLYDARGHGQSEGPAEPAAYTWETLGQDMAALAEHSGQRKAVFGGGSMGAATALWVALERPELVRGLILVVPPPLGHPPLRADEEKQALAVLDLLSHAVQNFGLEKTAELASAFPGFASTAEEADERATWLRSQNPLALTSAVRGLLESPYHDPERYRAISAPTLVLAHEGDGLHPARSAHLLAEMIPDCTVRVAPESGYWWRNQEAFAAEVADFLARLDEGPWATPASSAP